MSIPSIAIVGLGYVGLPLAIHLSHAGYQVHGVDIDESLINKLRAGERPNIDLPANEFPPSKRITFTAEMPKAMDFYIVCVPTYNVPHKAEMDTSHLLAACTTIGESIADNGTVVIESTVTPGFTNGPARCAVEKAKGDSKFHIAFSPERVNPGPAYFYAMVNAPKLIGSSLLAAKGISRLYRRIFQSVQMVGVEEAELAKTFENAQRDLNIALMNELAIQCQRKNLHLPDVIAGLRTKPSSPVFTSGMVGGHCIPVDPYFLAEYYGSDDCLALHGRTINESYIEAVGDAAIDCKPSDGPIVILGRTYKPMVSDTRNSGPYKLERYLKDRGHHVIIHDYRVDSTVYSGATPSVLIGAVNHYDTMRPFETYQCDTYTAFINIGGAFTEEQLQPFDTVIEI